MSATNRDLLLKIYKELQETKDKVKDIPEMKKQLEEIPKIKEELIPTMQQDILQIKEILKEIPEIKQELRNISGSVAGIEVEHGEKLAILFDAFKVNTEKIEEQNKRITKCEKILEKHDHQIYILNSKIQNQEIQNT